MIMVIAMTIIGGMGTIYGPVVGAFTITVGLELLRGFEDHRLLAFGILTILMMRFMPDGVARSVKALSQRVARRQP